MTWRRLNSLAMGLSGESIVREAIRHRPISNPEAIATALDRGFGEEQ